jgi:transcriptional regulator with XRE-family HTH domain
MMRRILILAAAMMALGVAVVAIGGAVPSANGDDGPVENFLAKVAEKLGVSEDELQTAIKDAQLETIDEAAADGSIIEEQADRLKERAQGSAPSFHRRPYDHNPAPGLIIASAAEVLDLEGAELVSQIKSGSSLADVANAQGMSREDLTAALIIQTAAHLDALVAEKKLTDEQAERIAQGIESNIDRIVDGHPQTEVHRCRIHKEDQGSPELSRTSITL